jgi:Glycosyl transferase family 11
MSVKVTLQGRLGNNLFQYALGRIIAESHGMELICEYPRSTQWIFMGQNQDIGPDATLIGLKEYFPNAPLCIPGRTIDAPIEVFATGMHDGWTGHTIDLQSVLANRSPRQIQLAGFFQRFEYYAPYCDRIRSWFRPGSITLPLSVADNDVLINIRRGFDYGYLGWGLSMSYYIHVLSGLRDLGRVYVCGTGIDDQVRRCLSKYKPIYFSGTPIEQFNFITRFNRIILSNSTFAWWAAFLSEAAEIYAPRAAHEAMYGFTGYSDVNLHTGESRYHEITNTAPAKFSTFYAVNNTNTVSFNNNRSGVVINRANGTCEIIPANNTNYDLLTWIIRQRGLITYDKIWKYYAGSDLGLYNLIGQLVKSGFMSVNHRYLD